MQTCTPSSRATSCTGSVMGPGSSVTRSQSSSLEQPGVKPVVAVSGSTTSSAPVAATQRRTMSTQCSRLAAIVSGLRGAAVGATCTAAAVKARMSAPPAESRPEGDTEQGDHPSGDDSEREAARALEDGRLRSAGRPAGEGARRGSGQDPARLTASRRPGRSAGASPAGAPAMSASRAAKNWPAILRVTPESMRWPTPPMAPPTEASAS